MAIKALTIWGPNVIQPFSCWYYTNITFSNQSKRTKNALFDITIRSPCQHYFINTCNTVCGQGRVSLFRTPSKLPTQAIIVQPITGDGTRGKALSPDPSSSTVIVRRIILLCGLVPECQEGRDPSLNESFHSSSRHPWQRIQLSLEACTNVTITLL